VKATGDEVLLTYTMPLPPGGILEEKVGVQSTIRYGGPNITFAKPVETFFELEIMSLPLFKGSRTMNSYKQPQSYFNLSCTLISPPSFFEKPLINFLANLNLNVSRLQRYSTDPAVSPLKCTRSPCFQSLSSRATLPIPVRKEYLLSLK